VLCSFSQSSLTFERRVANAGNLKSAFHAFSLTPSNRSTALLLNALSQGRACRIKSSGVASKRITRSVGLSIFVCCSRPADRPRTSRATSALPCAGARLYSSARPFHSPRYFHLFWWRTCSPPADGVLSAESPVIRLCLRRGTVPTPGTEPVLCCIRDGCAFAPTPPRTG